MNSEHETPEPGKHDRGASHGRAEGEQRSPPEKLAYSIPEFCEVVGLKRSTVYEEIKDGRLIARKARGRTIILPTDARNYLLNLPAIKAAVPKPAAA